MKRSVLLGLLALSLATGLTRAAVQSGAGLRAQYVAGSPADRRVITRVDAEPSTASITGAWQGVPPPQFRVEWTGYLVVGRPAPYTFATTSDDGSIVTIDGERVVDNGGDHGPQTRTGTIQLARGPHLVVIDYAQAAGDYEMQWLWARGGGSLTPVPGWVLWTKRTSYVRALASRGLDALFWLALITSAAVALWQGWQFKGRDLANTAARRWREGQGGRAALVRHGRSIALRRVVAPLVSIAIAFLLAEGAARLVFRTVRSSGDARTFFATRVSEPNPLNNFGYRDVTIPSKSSRYRIVVIGDSITWGVGLSEPERYTNVMQQRLGDAYEVFNFGIPGHNMPEHLQTLGPALSASPDFILLQLYTNDFETENMERPRARPLLPWRGADAWLLRSSAVYTMLAAQWPRIQEKVGLTETYEHYMYRYLGDPQSPESQRSFGMLHQFIATARDAGVQTGAVMFPNPGVLGRDYAFDYLHDRVQGVCAEEHVRCVDLRKPFLSSFTDLKEIVVSPFDGHPSARASVVAADAIVSAFKEAWRRRGDPSPGHQ